MAPARHCPASPRNTLLYVVSVHVMMIESNVSFSLRVAIATRTENFTVSLGFTPALSLPREFVLLAHAVPFKRRFTDTLRQPETFFRCCFVVVVVVVVVTIITFCLQLLDKNKIKLFVCFSVRPTRNRLLLLLLFFLLILLYFVCFSVRPTGNVLLLLLLLLLISLDLYIYFVCFSVFG